MNTRATPLLATAFLAAGLVTTLAAQGRRGPTPQRAERPKWNDDVRGLFFEDALGKLVGEAPDFGRPRTGAPTGSTPGGPDERPAAGGLFAWSKLISPDAIEDEIKAQKGLVEQTVTTPTKFKGGGNRDAARQFSTVAMMFAIGAEYDGDVRWKDDATGLRDRFGAAGLGCRVGTDQSYALARRARDDLANLIRGERPADLKRSDPKVVWKDVVRRPPLMQRMEEANDKRLAPWLASKAEFSNKTAEIYHEAQVLAVLGEVIQREGYEYWDDEEFAAYAKQLRDAAMAAAEAVKQNDYERARAAQAEMTKACSNCHEGYRA